MKLLLTKIENHACLICNSSSSIFQINKSANQLALIRNKKMRNMNTNNNKKKSKTDIKIFEQLNYQKNTNNNLTHIRTSKQLNSQKNTNNNLFNMKTSKLDNQKNTDNNLFSFPPSVPDKNLYHQIVSDAIKWIQKILKKLDVLCVDF